MGIYVSHCSVIKENNLKKSEEPGVVLANFLFKKKKKRRAEIRRTLELLNGLQNLAGEIIPVTRLFNLFFRCTLSLVTNKAAIFEHLKSLKQKILYSLLF